MTDTEKMTAGLNILVNFLLKMNRGLTYTLAIVRGDNRTVNCSLCGEERPCAEIKENNGYCQYCGSQDERNEKYTERRHPDGP